MIKDDNPELLPLLQQLDIDTTKLKVDSNGNTLLHLAILSENIEVAEYLIKKNIDPNVINRAGETPILQQFKYNFEETAAIKTLLKLGADPTIADNNGKTPRTELVERICLEDQDLYEIIEMLLV